MSTVIGIVGTGNIFPAYLKTLRRCRGLKIAGIADATPGVAKARAEAFGLKALPLQRLLEGEASVILNLTPPAAHHAVGMAVLQAGKHLFTEKPLAARFEDGKALVALARKRGLRIGAAPDTVLGAGAQTVRALLDADLIGPVRHGSAYFMNHGPDHWHPNPGFFYQPGAGPLMDVGVYHVTHLVHHLGPVREVRATAHLTHRERIVPLGERQGQRIRVEVPTHIVTQLSFEGGAEIVLTSSFDVWQHAHTPIEFYGDDGSLLAPDPNQFGGTVRHARQLGPWQLSRERRPYTTNSRGIGLIDMVKAIEEGRPHRCSEALALHVLEIMDRSLEAARLGRAVKLKTRCERPAPLDGKLF